MINTHNAQEEMNKENNANTSFVSEKSTSLDNNIKNQDEFDSETDDIDEKDSEIEIFFFFLMDDHAKIIKYRYFLIEVISSPLCLLV